MIIVDHNDLNKYATVLKNLEAPIAQRVDSLFCLRSFDELEAVDALIEAFAIESSSAQSSDLLRHEIAYCLGQMDKTPEHISKIQVFLEGIVEGDYPQIVVHEAVEALGNMSDERTESLIEEYKNRNCDISEMVIETCELAQDLIKWNNSTNMGETEGIDLKKLKFKTNDPAPPFNYKTDQSYNDVARLTSIMLDNVNFSLFDRYRAMFTLRELDTEESCRAICQTLIPENFDTCSPLLKHEVAFVLAQMYKVFHVAVPFLMAVCQEEREAAIVKHEGLVAVGEMIDDKSQIEPLLQHHDPIVAQSAAVAINNITNRLAEEEEMMANHRAEVEALNQEQAQA